MRMAVMAAGAVGGYFGGRMATAGHDVTFIARGAHGDAIRRDGLRIESALGDLHLKNLNVTTTRSRSDPSTWCCSPSSCGIPRRPASRRGRS